MAGDHGIQRNGPRGGKVEKQREEGSERRERRGRHFLLVSTDASCPRVYWYSTCNPDDDLVSPAAVVYTNVGAREQNVGTSDQNVGAIHVSNLKALPGSQPSAVLRSPRARQEFDKSSTYDSIHNDDDDDDLG